jgi:hypothetical protein
MANMTDQNRVNALLTALFSITGTGATTITPASGGGSAFSATAPYFLRLMTTQGSNVSNGVEATATNCPGYVVLGNTLGSPFNGTAASGQQTNSNPVTWNATGSWSNIVAVEVWDSSATKLRWLQGALTSAITGVANGDTVQFAAGSITTNASQW